jgi:hypothetical protein
MPRTAKNADSQQDPPENSQTTSTPSSDQPAPDSTHSETSVNDVVGTLISEEPTPNPAAVEQMRAQVSAEADATVKPSGFDSGIHATNADGSPKLNGDGSFAKKRGRKPGGAASAAPGQKKKLHIPGGAGVEMPPQMSQEMIARRGGANAASLLVMLGMGIGGEEWAPRKDDKIGMDEKAMLDCAFGDYFVANNMGDIPPGWALVAAVGMYSLPRFTMPKTRTRLQKVKGWFAAKYVQWKARRAGLRVKVSTESEAELVDGELRHRATNP